jgi:serine/threonine protein phosphatase PrpC
VGWNSAWSAVSGRRERVWFCLPMLMLSNALSAVMASDPGRVRLHNEDACAAEVERGAFVVCDGVGGAVGGEIASRVAADAMLEGLAASAGDGVAGGDRLCRGVALANQCVLREARQTRSLRGMGTTLVALLAEPAGAAGDDGRWGTVWLANVGDSRCYRLRRGVLEQMTEDHSLVEEQVRAGEITREQAERSPIRNVITRAVGSYARVEADVQSVAAECGDLYLLTTDGLTRELTDAEIAGILQMGQAPCAEHSGTKPSGMDAIRLERICGMLVDAANERGGGDNITCLLVQLKGRE